MYGQAPQEWANPGYNPMLPWTQPGASAGDVAMQRDLASMQRERELHERNVYAAETAASGVAFSYMLGMLVGRIIRLFRR
jgi:hypothetical protein